MTFNDEDIVGITKNPAITVLEMGRADGILILKRDGDEVFRGGSTAIEAWSHDDTGWHREYEANVDSKFHGLTSSDGQWGVNIQGTGPWNTVERARLAAQVISIAANLAAERNAADMLRIVG